MAEDRCELCGFPFWADWDDHAYRHSKVLMMQRAATACRAAELDDLADEVLRRIGALNRQEKKAS